MNLVARSVVIPMLAWMILQAGGVAWGVASEAITVTAAVQESLTLRFGGRTVSFGNLDPTRGPAFLSNALTFNVRSNAPWSLTVVATDDLRNVQNPGAVIPAERLLLRRVGEATFQPVSKATPRVVAGGGPTPEQGLDVSFDLQLTVQWKDVAGPYQTNLTFVLTAGP